MAEVTNSKLLNTDAGILKKNACIVLVKTEWNAAIVDELEKGCREKLASYQSKKNNNDNSSRGI
jgi:6,7-dimethyl-8-ribityllumazine synthase